MSRRDEIRKYENDVFYEAWSRGLNPDRAVECAEDCYWNGREPEQCVDGYQRHLLQQRQQREYEVERQQEEPGYE